ncbi:hypothetical protein AAG570_008884 [Ranatra chinensis]|uniref:Nardilysin n=1 Tax=Ranatra chinensis TaxID=642074 RepID=A0ABD0Z2U8_9HEMI
MSKRCKLDPGSGTNAVQNKAGRVNDQEPPETGPGSITYLPLPNKSPNDQKEYCVIKLANGLTALLISDVPNLIDLEEEGELDDDEGSETGSENSGSDEESDVSDEELGSQKGCKSGREEKMAACALCIGVGSFSDPDDIPGLAHFLEHMVFMGSEKYPKENEFDAFIKRKGGSDNASTECEYTTFYFECHDQHLHRGMDMFSQFFISPLMKRDAMTREREAIESEFQMSLPSDTYRKQQLICGTAHPDNPARKFMWGNLITLRDNVTDDYLHESVHKFWEGYYSAHHMKLAVQARLPLKTLEKWVVECFSSVPSNNLPTAVYKPMEETFQNKLFNRIYIVESVKDICELEISWIMPSVMDMYKSKPADYISWIIGHEGKGSLISYLRKHLWALDITAGHGDDGCMYNSIYTMFSATIVLTESGYSNLELVLEAVFSYIKMLQITGPEERIFNEIRCIEDTKFKYSEESPPVDYVEMMSENMHFFPPSDYITGGELYFEYKPEEIEMLLGYMTPSRANIIVSSKKASKEHVLDQIEPWFKTRYTTKEISQELLSKLEEVLPFKDFFLPEPNLFIPSDFSLLPFANPTAKYPEIIKSTDLVEIFYKQDTKFKLPFAYICCNIITDLPHQSVTNCVLQDLFIVIIKQLLVEEVYPASMAQLDYNLSASEKGLMIVVNGFNEKLNLLLEKILYYIVNFNNNVNKGLFHAMKKVLSRQYINSSLKPGFLAREIRMKLLLKTCCSTTERYNALSKVNLDELMAFSQKCYKNVFVQCLIQGNISKEQSLSVCDNLLTTLGCEPLEKSKMPEIRVHELPRGEHCCRVKSFNLEDTNCITVNYYQMGLGQIKEYCLLEMLIMLMEEPIFDTLRTQEQLGYDVSCTLRDTFGVLGFSVTVVSQINKHSVDHVEQRITNFLENFSVNLKSMPLEDYQEVVTSLVKLKLCGDVYLKEEVKRNWDEIKSREYIFDRSEREVSYISGINLEDIDEFLKDQIGLKEDSNFRKLTVQVVGHDHSIKENEVNDTESDIYVDLITESPEKPSNYFIKDIYSFNKNLVLYPPKKIE